jgi:hypothetical protein
MQVTELIRDYDALLTGAAMAFLAAAITVVLAGCGGALIAFFARRTASYVLLLAMLFFPFAVGSAVWAYAMTRLAASLGLITGLTETTTTVRAAVICFLCLARTVPLGIFFCSTTLHRYTREMLPYFRNHRLRLWFFISCAITRLPKSVLLVLGLLSGSLAGLESALPKFLYRANPGTRPEPINTYLARHFHEIYATQGADSLSQVAVNGFLASVFLLAASAAGTFLGTHCLCRIARRMLRMHHRRRYIDSAAALAPPLMIAVMFAPTCAALWGMALPPKRTGLSGALLADTAMTYFPIVAVGFVVGVILTVGSIAIAVGLRYARRDRLSALERQPAAACLLAVPAFFPLLTVLALVGSLSSGRMQGIPAFLTMGLCHVVFHCSVILLIAMTLIAAIPEPHVMWQRLNRMSYAFSLITDGFKRHLSATVSLIGLGTVVVITDGSISGWFSTLIRAPDESLQASVFGRLSSHGEAYAIACAIAMIAATISTLLAVAYVREQSTT